MPITREIRTEVRLKDPNIFDLSCVSAAERLFIWRHRQLSESGRLLGRNGPMMSQAEAADELGVSRNVYSKLESGLRSGLSAEEIERLAAALGPFEPSLGELCFLARRRSGLLLTWIERELGMSRPHFHAQERAGDWHVVEFWKKRGYRFPLA